MLYNSCPETLRSEIHIIIKWGNILLSSFIYDTQCIVRCSTVGVSTGIIRNTAVGPLLPDRLNAQRYCDFLVTVLPGLLEDGPLAVRQGLWFQHERAPVHYVEDVQQ
jgi:hypothetical protein